MRALIVSGGQTDPEQLRQEVTDLRASGGLLIAADSGLQALDCLICWEDPGIFLPDVAVGDFDSVDPQVLERFLQWDQIRIERHRPEKNETDTELAFTIAQEAGVTEIVLMGATGTRLDHVLSNVHLLKAARDRGLSCTLLDRYNRICLAEKSMEFQKEEQWPFVSLVPLSMEVTGVTLQGFKYPLQDHRLILGQECGLCVSNELAAEKATLEMKEGLLLVIRARDK